MSAGTVQPGFRVEINAMGDWVPFVVTHVREDEGTIDGVAFSARYPAHDWARCTQSFTHVERGEGNRQWRPIAPPEPADTADAGGDGGDDGGGG